MRYGWSLAEEDWRLLPSELVTGKVWRSVQFTVADANSVPTHPAVYLICTYPPGRRRGDQISPNDLFGLLYTAIYIGKSENLRQRFYQHCANPRAEIQKSRECFEDSLEFWFTRVDADQLDTIESLLIECLGPPANTLRGVITARLESPIPA